MGKVNVKARVQVTVEIDVFDAWGEDCELKQVHKQAKEKALGSMFSQFERPRMRIIGEPLCVAVLTEETK